MPALPALVEFKHFCRQHLLKTTDPLILFLHIQLLDIHIQYALILCILQGKLLLKINVKHILATLAPQTQRSHS